MKSPLITPQEVQKVAKLANLTISPKHEEKFCEQFASVIDYISKIQTLNTSDIKETSQVTGLTNVFREDTIDKTRMFTQEAALLNAKRKHNGYFVVSAVFEE